MCGRTPVYAVGRCRRDYAYRWRTGHDRGESTLFRDLIRALERQQVRDSMLEGFCCDLVFLDRRSWVLCERRENHIGSRHRARGVAEWFWAGPDLFWFPAEEAEESSESMLEPA